MKAMSWMPVSARSSRRGVERRLDLARHQLRRGVAHEVAHVGPGVGGEVEELVGRDAGPGVAGDVAHGVAAALAARQAGVGELADELGRVVERHVVDLDVLARGDVTLVERRVALDAVREGLQLLGRDPAHRQLHPDHLHVGLALAVDALLQAEADELRLGRLAAQVLRRLGVEVVELALEDGDDVAGNVLEDLWVLDRTPALGHRERSGLHCGVGLLARSARGLVKVPNADRDSAIWPLNGGDSLERCTPATC